MRQKTILLLSISLPALGACQVTGGGRAMDSLAHASEAASSPLPYSKGEPEAFIAHASGQGRPSLILFNFSLESG